MLERKEVKNELYKAFKRLGATHELLCIIGSWGEEISEEESLEDLKYWNKVKKSELCDKVIEVVKEF